MHLWTKAAILLIVTNSMASSYQSNGRQKTINLRDNGNELEKYVNCSESAKKKETDISGCLQKKWGGITDNKSKCCFDLDSNQVFTEFDKKECEVKDGYDAYRQEKREAIEQTCQRRGVDPVKDCTDELIPVPKDCYKWENSSAQKVMVQTDTDDDNTYFGLKWWHILVIIAGLLICPLITCICYSMRRRLRHTTTTPSSTTPTSTTPTSTTPTSTTPNSTTPTSTTPTSTKPTSTTPTSTKPTSTTPTSTTPESLPENSADTKIGSEGVYELDSDSSKKN